MVTKKILVNLCIASLFIASSTQVLASAFQSFEQNGSGLGNAYAGMAVNDNNDASTEFSNPAAMTLLKKPEVDVSTVVVDAHSQYTATKATNQFGSIGGDLTKIGTRRSYPLGVNPLPALHYVQPLTQRLFFGFGITVPFGLETDYSKHSVARYFATKSKIMTINIGPSLAFKIAPWLSFGAGIDIQYIKAELDQQIDFGAIVNSVTDISKDGSLNNTASDWGWGGNVGVLLHLDEDTRVGLTYRSPIFYHPTGNSIVNYGNLTADEIRLAKEAGIISSKHLSTKMVMPETVVFSLMHNFSPHWQTLGAISWTRWDRFRKLDINFHSQIPNAEVHEDFHNTMRYAVGLNYLLNRWWTFRVGFAYDNSPTDNSHRTSRLPDADRTWYSLGFQYAILKSLTVNLGYSYIHIGDGYVHETLPSTGASLDAHFDHSYAHLFGLQVNWLI